MFHALVLALALAAQNGPLAEKRAPAARTAPAEKRAPAEKPPTVDPRRVDAAVVELTAAFDKGTTPDQRVRAIQRTYKVVDARVIELIELGLSDRDQFVVRTAVEACGRMRHSDALEALNSFWKLERERLVEDERLYPVLLRSIGRHGSPTSISLLAEDPFAQRAYATVQARVMALGNIRSKLSVSALIDISTLVGRNRMEGVRHDIRIALARLTGRDPGPDSAAWLAWWQASKKDLEVSAEPQPMDALLQQQWDRYWGPLEKPTVPTAPPERAEPAEPTKPARKGAPAGGTPRGG